MLKYLFTPQNPISSTKIPNRSPFSAQFPIAAPTNNLNRPPVGDIAQAGKPTIDSSVGLSRHYFITLGVTTAFFFFLQADLLARRIVGFDNRFIPFPEWIPTKVKLR